MYWLSMLTAPDLLSKLYQCADIMIIRLWVNLNLVNWITLEENVVCRIEMEMKAKWAHHCGI